MITDLITTLREIGEKIYAVFVSPGQFVLSWLTDLSPSVAAALNIVGNNEVVVSIFISLLLWTLLAIVIAKVFSFLQNFFRVIAATSRTLSFRISLAFGNIRKSVSRALQRWIPQRTDGAVAVSGVELDDLDVAVLQSTAACGPGFATSAPDLAEQLRHRPAQIQRSLNKLSKKLLLEDVIGSTDGFDNYRLSESGSHYVAMLRRNIGNS